MKFTALLRGSCRLAGEHLAEPIALAAGDCFLLTTAGAYRLASDLSLPPDDARAVFADAVHGCATLGRGDGTLMIGGRFGFDPHQTAVLLDGLPPVIHVRAARASGIPWILERLAGETAGAEPGAALMLDHLAHMLFVEVLRAHLASGAALPIGWLGALTDPRIGKALNLLHGDPGRPWTLAQLTAAVGMSRSAFAHRFRQLVGTGPLDYLLRWHMRLAAQALEKRTGTPAAIAFSLGYQSESAFGNAFKRVMGVAPRKYQEGAAGDRKA